MIIPKTANKYCKTCKKYTEHAISQAKKKERGALKRGSLVRVKMRGLGIGHGNLGRWGSKGAMSSWKRYGAKTSKKLDLRLTCKECKKSSIKKQGFRAKKVEMK